MSCKYKKDGSAYAHSQQAGARPSRPQRRPRQERGSDRQDPLRRVNAEPGHRRDREHGGSCYPECEHVYEVVVRSK